MSRARVTPEEYNGRVGERLDQGIEPAGAEELTAAECEIDWSVYAAQTGELVEAAEKLAGVLVDKQVDSPGLPDERHAPQRATESPRAPAQRRVQYFPRATREWLQTLARAEGALLTLSQTLIESLVGTLPPSDLAAYIYLRSLATNADTPGRCYISHATLGEKVHAREKTAKRITARLRGAGIIRRVRRGFGAHKTANVYGIVALTPDVLEQARRYYTTVAEGDGVTGDPITPESWGHP